MKIRLVRGVDGVLGSGRTLYNSDLLVVDDDPAFDTDYTYSKKIDGCNYLTVAFNDVRRLKMVLFGGPESKIVGVTNLNMDMPYIKRKHHIFDYKNKDIKKDPDGSVFGAIHCLGHHNVYLQVSIASLLRKSPSFDNFTKLMKRLFKEKEVVLVDICCFDKYSRPFAERVEKVLVNLDLYNTVKTKYLFK